MSLIPEEEFKKQNSISLAPMVDFLFLVIAIFATMAITRTALFDTEVNLVRLQKEESRAPLEEQKQNIVHISITEEGRYKWITETSEFLIDGPEGIQKELVKQQKLGLIPQDAERTKVLLHIDKEAKWEPIARAVFAIRESGFSINPVYEPTDLASE